MVNHSIYNKRHGGGGGGCCLAHHPCLKSRAIFEEEGPLIKDIPTPSNKEACEPKQGAKLIQPHVLKIELHGEETR